MSGSGSDSAKVLHEDSGIIETSYSCLALRAWDDELLQGAVPADNTLITILEGSSDRIEELIVNTADQWGPFHVAAHLYDMDPGDPGAEWEDVVEMSLTSASALVVTELVDNDPQIELLPGPGQYRLRVSARGRRIRDFDSDDELDEDTSPTEWYLLEAWPAPATDPIVIRLTSPFAQNELNPPAPLVIPEGEAGLAASVRIGRDVDRKPGARTLSGDLGSVEVRRTIRGTRRRLFRLCSHLVTWSHVWLGPPSWSWTGGPGDEYELHRPEWASADDNPDQMSGSTGSIRCSYTDVKKPVHAVRTWNWMVPPDGRDLTLAARVPVLAEDAQITVDLTEAKDADGQAWTTIRITHAGLPVEWLDDMETYWGYQLAIADHANFGIPK